MDETIAAISTPLGQGGICVIRMSGDSAIAIADEITRLSGSLKPSQLDGYRCAYGRIEDEGETIDEAIVTIFRAPRSYTGEDVVEISAHGGTYIARRVLQACLSHGARIAAAGEFTKRAFLNGKLDLTRAEAVADLISATDRLASRAALTARDGALFKRATGIANELKSCSAALAAWIDYPDEDTGEVDANEFKRDLLKCRDELRQLLNGYEQGQILKTGIPTAIIGRPNTGKSTLMNLLAGSRRSIVSDTAGTTRDVVTQGVRLGEITLLLADTAGIRESADEIESVGVELARGEAKRSQLILAVFDGSCELTADDERVINECSGIPAIAILNKQDLNQCVNLQRLQDSFARVVPMSAKKGIGQDELLAAIRELFDMDAFDAGAAVVANERQRGAVAQAVSETDAAIGAIDDGVSLDAVGVCVESALDAILTLTGERASEQIVDEVFSRFCVGK